MAKFGEGDERWIVKEREDGRNCNNWHWTSKDVSANTKAELIATLERCTFEPPLGLAKIKSAEVTGEASVNNRKGKIFLIYDFEVRDGRYRRPTTGAELWTPMLAAHVHLRYSYVGRRSR